jgi:hypothetical protein
VNTSSVLPRFRHDKPDLQGKIDLVNTGLQALCQEEGATFVNNAPSFKLMDKTINDGYFVPDHKDKNASIHSSRAGTNRLVENLGLQCRNDGDDVAPSKNTIKSQNNHKDDHECETSHSLWDHAREKANKPPRQERFAQQNKHSNITHDYVVHDYPLNADMSTVAGLASQNGLAGLC